MNQGTIVMFQTALKSNLKYKNHSFQDFKMSSFFQSYLFVLILLISNSLFVNSVFAQDDLEKDPLTLESSLSNNEWNPGQGGQLQLKLHLPAGFHAYEEQFKLKITAPEGFKSSLYKLEPIHDFFDKNSKKNRKGIEGDAVAVFNLEAPEVFYNRSEVMEINFTYQACGDSFCLFPITKKIKIPIKINTGSISQIEPVQNNAIPDQGFLKEKLNLSLAEGSWVTFLIVFLAGVLTSFTPCIFPMIPITLAILAQGAEKRSRLQNFLLSLAYVHGIALTYSILGVVAASSGSVFGATLGNKYILGFMCALFLLMSLSMYGLFEIQVPAVIRNKFGKSHDKEGYFGAFITGLFTGLVASPCVGPVLVSILAFVSTSNNKVFGFFILFTYAMGLGLIFLMLGLFGQLTRYLPRSGPWMDGIKFVLGSLMLGTFYYYLDLLIPQRIFDGLLGIGLVVLASVAGAFKKHPTTNRKKIQKGFLLSLFYIGIGFILLGTLNLRPLLEKNKSESSNQNCCSVNGETLADGNQIEKSKLQWHQYDEFVLKQAQEQHKPVIIDFWAEWCRACHELADETFQDVRVISLMKDFVLIKYDATQESDELSLLKKKYKIQGLPTLIFYDQNGLLREDLTLTEFEKPEKFVERLKKTH